MAVASDIILPFLSLYCFYRAQSLGPNTTQIKGGGLTGGFLLRSLFRIFGKK